MIMLEMQGCKEHLLSDNFNNFGFTLELTREFILIAFVLAKRTLAVTAVGNGEDGGIEIRGKALDYPAHGIAAVSLNDESGAPIKQIDVEHIEFDDKT